MEERKTAAHVLTVLGVIAIVAYLLISYYRSDKQNTLTYKCCTVKIEYLNHPDTNDDGYRAAKCKLALCLSDAYTKKPDKEMAGQIIYLFKNCGSVNGPDSIKFWHFRSIDSILKYRKSVFDTVILVD